MKKSSNSLFTQLSNTAMESLTHVVNETLATVSVQVKTNKVFTNADLWSIQRQTKARTTRRFL